MKLEIYQVDTQRGTPSLYENVGTPLAYGMSKFKLADTMGISVDEADRIIKKFFAVVPKVEEFLNNLGNLGKSRGYIRTGDPFRRIRWFPKFKDSIDNTNPEAFKLQGEIERASKNTPRCMG